MSYSRWSNSVWYTYWTTFSPEMEYKLPSHDLKRYQILEIAAQTNCHVTYGDIEDFGLKGVIKKIKKHYSQPYKQTIKVWDEENQQLKETEVLHPPMNPTLEQLNELVGYIAEFQKDVDEHFRWSTFFYYEWWLPTKNSLIFKYRKIRKNKW